MKKQENKYMILGLIIFFSLLISSIIITVSVVKQNRIEPEDFSSSYIRANSKHDIIDGESIIPPIELESQTTIKSYQNQNADILYNTRPTPLFPQKTGIIQNQNILEKKSILRNLYKQSNKYYIKENEKNKFKQQSIKGIDE